MQTFLRQFTEALTSEVGMQGVNADIYVAETDSTGTESIHLWGMSLPIALRNKIITFLVSLPHFQDSPAQRAFIASLGVDPQIENQLPFGGPKRQFVELMVSILTRYGKFADGRNALEALLETAKEYVGKDLQDYCDTLFHALRDHSARLKEKITQVPITPLPEYNEAQIKALCMSGCMIVVFTPAYFKDKQYQLACAVEYKFMEKLEQERIKLLRLPGQNPISMIIPVIYRGEMTKCPNEIKAHRQSYDFSHYIFQEQGFLMDREHAPKVQEIAQQIAEVYERLEALSSDEQHEMWHCWRTLAQTENSISTSEDDPCETCDDLAISDSDLADIKNWLKKIAIPNSPFPGRREEQYA